MQKYVHVKCWLLVGIFFVATQDHLAGMKKSTVNWSTLKNLTVDELNKPDTKGNTLLYYAIKDDNNLFADEFINKKKVNINIVTKKGSLLHLIMNNFKNDIDAIRFYTKMLFQSKGEKFVQINAVNNLKKTALHLAVEKVENAEIIKILIDQGANVNAVDMREKTPLHYAASKDDNFDVVKLLIEHGADATIENKDKDRASALAENPSDTRDLLERMEQIAEIQNLLNNPNHADAIKYMGDLLHYEDTLLLVPETIMINLIKKFTPDEINAFTTKQPPFLHSLAQNDLPVFFKYAPHLLDAGANVNGADNQNTTPLGSATARGYEPAVQFLIDRGADVNIQSKNGWTALHRASQKDRFDIVKLLIEHGADAGIKNTKNEKASDLADHGSDTQSFLWEMEKIPEIDNFITIKDYTGAINKLGSFFYSGLSILVPEAIVKKTTQKIKELIKKIPEESYKTTKPPIFHLLIRKPKSVLDYAESLVQAGANINAQTIKGNTALHLAALTIDKDGDTEEEKKDALAAVKLLIKLMIKYKEPSSIQKPFDIQNNDGKTALDLLRLKMSEEEIKTMMGEISKEILAQAPKKKLTLEDVLQELQNKLTGLKNNLSSLSTKVVELGKKLK